MNKRQMKKILSDMAHPRVSGTDQETAAAEYLKARCEELGVKAWTEPFEVGMSNVLSASLTADGESIPCRGYKLCGSGSVTAPFIYLPSLDKAALAGAKGRIVLIDGYLGLFPFKDLVESGAAGFITYDGNVRYTDRDIDSRSVRDDLAPGSKLLGVNINAKDAAKLVKAAPAEVTISVEQKEYKGTSHNVVAELPGSSDEWIVLTAHYDSSPLSPGVWDNMSGCVGILSDVTSAERLEQTRRDYVANVSHELRTPLTALRALIEPLRDGLVKTDEQRQQIYDVVLRETMRLSRLVNDMLELSRLQSGNASLQRSVFSVLPLLGVIRDTYTPYADDYQQTFLYEVPDALPDVVGNPDRTQQVLVALLDNAMKYTPEGGTVTLHAEVLPEVVRISVSDTGIGISSEDLPHVFDRFYKADKAHQSRGTGLGLAIAYEIMKQLGEEMKVESELGKGSVFSFTLHRALS